MLQSKLSVTGDTSRSPPDEPTKGTTSHAPTQGSTTSIPDHRPSTSPFAVYQETTVAHGNNTGTQVQNFQVELSIVLAVGGFLLFLNLIILGVIYYLRDKKKIESRLAAKYLAHLEEIKKKKANGRGFMQTTPDSGIGFATLLNAHNGKGTSTIGTGSHQSSRDGTIRINEDGDIEFEV